jgi:hypothetical protein
MKKPTTGGRGTNDDNEWKGYDEQEFWKTTQDPGNQDQWYQDDTQQLYELHHSGPDGSSDNSTVLAIGAEDTSFPTEDSQDQTMENHKDPPTKPKPDTKQTLLPFAPSPPRLERDSATRKTHKTNPPSPTVKSTAIHHRTNTPHPPTKPTQIPFPTPQPASPH